jgi:hypothetical protein
VIIMRKVLLPGLLVAVIGVDGSLVKCPGAVS